MIPLDTAKILAVAHAIGAVRLKATCIYLVNQMRQNLSVPGRTKKIVTTRTGKTRTKWGRLNSEPSKPGEFPRKQTGTLRSSVTHDIDPTTLTAKVGTALAVGKWLELGTRKGKGSKMAPRPWLLKTVLEERPAIDRIMSGK